LHFKSKLGDLKCTRCARPFLQSIFGPQMQPKSLMQNLMRLPGAFVFLSVLWPTSLPYLKFGNHQIENKNVCWNHRSFNFFLMHFLFNPCFHFLICSFSILWCIRIIIYLYKMAACSNLLSMKLIENLKISGWLRS